MFKSLSERLNSTLDKVKGSGRLTEENIYDALRDVRMALLEADVSLPIVKKFIADIKQEALGKKVMSSLTPGQAFISLVKKHLEHLMGDENESLDLKAQPPVVILLAGLQGSGKTTTAGKLAKYLMEKQNKKVMAASADVYRPAAIDQLETLCKENNIEFFPSASNQKPVNIAKEALVEAKKSVCDVLILDTAGRMHIDADMMDEVSKLHQVTMPKETLFVVDSMSGQDAATTAKAFGEALPLTGVILTKADGDSRGGAALSVREVTGKPIKFIGTGEKSDALEAFHPERMASRILGMGDMLSLIEEAEQKVDRSRTDKLVRKIKKGQSFDLEDFMGQLQQMKKMGGVGSIVDKLPGVNAGMADTVKDRMNNKMFVKMEAVIQSMTKEERRKPDLIKSSRKRRIAAGSGTEIQDVNRLLKQFTQMQKMMKKMKGKGGAAKMMNMMKGGLGGGMPGQMQGPPRRGGRSPF